MKILKFPMPHKPKVGFNLREAQDPIRGQDGDNQNIQPIMTKAEAKRYVKKVMPRYKQYKSLLRKEREYQGQMVVDGLKVRVILHKSLVGLIPKEEKSVTIEVTRVDRIEKRTGWLYIAHGTLLNKPKATYRIEMFDDGLKVWCNGYSKTWKKSDEKSIWPFLYALRDDEKFITFEHRYYQQLAKMIAKKYFKNGKD